MKICKILLVLLTLSALAALVAGCSNILAGAGEASDTMVAAYSTDSLRNYKAGRDFAAMGRYELAREHYLLALASANSQDLQEALAFELDSIDLMIRSLR